MKPNPYHYPIFDNRLISQDRSNLEQIMYGPANVDMKGLNEAIIRQPLILDKVFKILKCRYNDCEIVSFNCLRKIQAQNILNRKSEEPDFYTDLVNPIDMSSIMMTIACHKPKGVNWSAFRELYLSLNKEQARDIAFIFDLTYQASLDSLFDDPRGLWEIPQKINELKEQIHVNGNDFLKNGHGKWKRTDLAVRNFHVSIVKNIRVYDNEEDEMKFQRKTSVAGCAATIEGAIEVASRILEKLHAIYEVDESGVSFRFNDECIELHIKDNKGEVLLKADLKEEMSSNFACSYITGYEAQWLELIPECSIDNTLEKIKNLNAEAAEESRWDNFSTAKSLRNQAQKLREKLPSTKYDSYELHRILRHTLSSLGDTKQARNLLIQDLSI